MSTRIKEDNVIDNKKAVLKEGKKYTIK